MRRWFNTLALGLLVAIGALTACSSGPAPATPTAPATKVSIQLGWVYDFSTAQFYSAQKLGRYAAQNLDVDLQQGGFVNGQYVDAVEEVSQGKADFGLTSDLSIMQARAKGQDLVAVASMTQRSPEAVLSLPKSNIRRPQDLVGHKVAVADGAARELYDTLLRKQNIDPTKVTTVPRKSFGIDELVNGDVDAIVGWTINEGLQLQASKLEPNVMLLSDYGLEYYNTVLFTSGQMIKNKPDVVQRVVAATLQGINDVVANPAQAVDFTLSYGKDLKRDAQLVSLQAMIPLINPPGSKPGSMDANIWQASFQMAVDEKLLDKSVDFTTAYTLAFLNKIYG